jgi:hypothetical protein
VRVCPAFSLETAPGSAPPQRGPGFHSGAKQGVVFILAGFQSAFRVKRKRADVFTFQLLSRPPSDRVMGGGDMGDNSTRLIFVRVVSAIQLQVQTTKRGNVADGWSGRGSIERGAEPQPGGADARRRRRTADATS